jgi:hypothetical protein
LPSDSDGAQESPLGVPLAGPIRDTSGERKLAEATLLSPVSYAWRTVTLRGRIDANDALRATLSAAAAGDLRAIRSFLPVRGPGGGEE